MLEAAFFRHDRVPGNVLYLAYDWLAVEIAQAHALGSDDCEVAIGEEKQVACVVKDRGYVGGNEILIFPKTDNRRRPVASGNNLVRLVHRDDGESKNACELDNRLSHCLFQ